MAGFAAMPEMVVDGTKLPDDAARDVESLEVADHLFLPDTFMLRFRDPHRDVLGRAKLKIGSKIVIKATSLDDRKAEPLFKGEVTSLEADYDATGSHTVVRGYDESHRLHRGRRTASYAQVTASELVRKVAERAGLRVGKVDSTSTIYQHVSQANQTDWEFLRALGDAIGYDVAVLDGELHFRAPVEAASAPQPGRLDSQDRLQLVLGSELESFHPRVSSAEQVKSVEVRSWDPKQKKVLVAAAGAATTSASLRDTPSALAKQFGDGKLVAVETPFATQAECEAAAKALAERVAAVFAEAEAVARGDPRLRAGASVSIGLAGDAFSGRYSVTSSTHTFDPERGYKTHLAFSGRHERSLLALASSAAAHGRSSIDGAVVGIVTNANDPDGVGRVKLKLPWLSDDYESDWARVSYPGAGKDRGLVLVPEVDDEVLVVFEHGDIRRPYVLGGLFNGVDKPKSGATLISSGEGRTEVRELVSRLGHSLTVKDAPDGGGVFVKTKDGKQTVALDTAHSTVRIASNGDIVIEGGGKVTVRASGDLSLESKTALSLKAPKIAVAADAKVEVKGGQLELKSNGPASLEGAATTVKGNATLDVQASGPVTVKGALIRLN
jgi:uncharacterized protein involved in type VI secretion and phage assembly